MSQQPFAQILELPGVPHAVAAARAAVDRLSQHPMILRQRERVAAEAALRGGRASASLEGADVPLDVVRRAVTGGKSLEGAAAPTVEGALRVISGLGALRGTWGRAPLQVLARLHTLCAAGLVDADQLGRPRQEFTGSARLSSLVQLLTSRVEAPALVVAAIVHGELLAAQPFQSGSGIVARAAERLTLITAGLDPEGVSAPEVGYVELGRSEYAAAAAAYATGEADGVASWVQHCADATLLGARDMLAFCDAIQRGP